MSGVTHHLHL